ncbi:lipoprotein [Clostridium sediminicola]|uniref:hypothetical protein n=1 Tax=Clostridium sediminicola TaxID=3114879 RepID=UPI0031F24494
MNKSFKLFIVYMLFLFSIFFVGCSRIDDLKVKIGMKNTDFEYVKEGKIKQITIENVRDKSYKFIVKDENSIMQIYDILSKADRVDAKIPLTPDYIISLEDKSSNVYKFSYVAGIDKTETGNFYNDDTAYIVSKRLDNDIIKYFWNLRRPSDFNDVYYGNILKSIDKYYKGANINKLGINLLEDREVMKFILTLDMETFKGELPKNVKIIETNDKKDYDTVMHITTAGYKSEIFKCIIKFENKKSNKSRTFYIINKYNDGIWSYEFYEDKKPNNF